MYNIDKKPKSQLPNWVYKETQEHQICPNEAYKENQEHKYVQYINKKPKSQLPD